MKIPFVFWEFRGLDPLVNVVGRGILVGRFRRCLLSKGAVYGSSKELKDNHRWNIQTQPFVAEQRGGVTDPSTISTPSFTHLASRGTITHSPRAGRVPSTSSALQEARTCRFILCYSECGRGTEVHRLIVCNGWEHPRQRRCLKLLAQTSHSGGTKCSHPAAE